MPAIDWKERLIRSFDAVAPIDSRTTDALLARWKKEISLKRNDFLIRTGETEGHLYFISEGTLRIFYPHHEEEICVGFAYENNIVCSYPSFVQQTPSAYAIQALSKAKAIGIRHADFYAMLDEFPMVERVWRIIQEQALVGKINREVELLTFTPEERYERLMKRSPHIFQLIPRKYIASYLRMTPERLSRIKPS